MTSPFADGTAFTPTEWQNVSLTVSVSIQLEFCEYTHKKITSKMGTSCCVIDCTNRFHKKGWIVLCVWIPDIDEWIYGDFWNVRKASILLLMPAQDLNQTFNSIFLSLKWIAKCSVHRVVAVFCCYIQTMCKRMLLLQFLFYIDIYYIKMFSFLYCHPCLNI